MTITAEQCRAGRSLLGMKQEELCSTADVTHKTLSDFESGKTTPYASTLNKLRSALESSGVVFVDPNGLGPGVRLKDAGKA